MVVPRSAIEVTSDDEFLLYAVTTFKKHSADFQHKCREARWTPRDYKYVEGGREEEQKEVEKVSRDERKTWGEALRLSRTGWSESVMIWLHVLTLRVFVETVLRYGLPLDYVAGLIKVCVALAFEVKTNSPRQIQKLQRRRKLHLILRTHTSEETHLVEIRRGGLRKMTQHCHQIWLLQALVAMEVRVASTQHMSIMTLRLYRLAFEPLCSCTFTRGPLICCTHPKDAMQRPNRCHSKRPTATLKRAVDH